MFMPPKYYKLLTPLNKLDPTDPRKVENWLIKLRAVADCKGAFLPPISRAVIQLTLSQCPPSTRRPPTPTSLMAAKVSTPGLRTRANARATP